MGDDRNRNDSGQFQSEHSDSDVIEAVRLHEPAGTSEVADELGVARQSADYRLRKLADRGRVAKKTAGNSLVWTAKD